MGLGFSSIAKGIGDIGGGLGSLLGGAAQVGGFFTDPAAEEAKRQREFAQNSIQWRVADARAAGIHPLAALGAQVSGYVPVSASGQWDQLAAGFSNLGKGAEAIAMRDRLERESEANIREKDAVSKYYEEKALSEATSRTMAINARQSPDITAELLDPSYVTYPNGRLSMWRDPTGKWQYVDTSQPPQEVLEQEYGDIADWQGYARAVESLPDFGGYLRWPTLRELWQGRR